MYQHADISSLKNKLMRWNDLTEELCEELNYLFNEITLYDEDKEYIKELISKYQWDNISLSPYCIKKLDGVLQERKEIIEVEPLTRTPDNCENASLDCLFEDRCCSECSKFKVRKSGEVRQ